MTEPAREELYIEPVGLDLAFGDPDENLRRMEKALRARLRAAKAPAQARLFLFPELTLTGFVTRDPPSFALEPGDPRYAALSRLAREHGTALAAGLPERNPSDPKRPFNTLALFGPDGGLRTSYRKLHLFTLGPSPETDSYSAGERGATCLYRGWRLGLSICFDLRFARLYHAYARAGVEVLLAPSCWVGGPHKSRQFKALACAHAVLSQAYLAAVNRSGRDPHYEYDGAEYVFSPAGVQLWRSRPVALEAAELEKCRRLSVRPSDRADYPIG